MFQIDNLVSGYGQSQILHELNLDVAKKEIVAVMGRNGMGKTTLFKSLMGVLPQWGGQISVDGQDISRLETHQRLTFGVVVERLAGQTIQFLVARQRGQHGAKFLLAHNPRIPREHAPAGVLRIGLRAKRDLKDILLVLIHEDIKQSRRSAEANGQHSRRRGIKRAQMSRALFGKDFSCVKHNVA